MSKWILPVVVLGGLGLGGYFLFGTREGQRMTSDLVSHLLGPPEVAAMEDIAKAARDAGYDSPFKYYKGNEDAWDPESKRYKKIQKRIWDKNKKVQQEYIESYLADAF